MPSTIVTDEIVLTTDSGRVGPGRGGDTPGRGGGDGGSSGESSSIPQRTYTTGVTVGLAAILMLFMALVSAFVVRKGSADDWIYLTMPRILWLNTAILLASSWTLFRSRQNLASSDFAGFRHWWMVTTILGFLFLVGQLMAWRILVSEGVYLSTNPSSSFFYVFTAAHGLHLLGGILGLLYVAVWPVKRERQLAVTKAAALYWRFMDGLWVFIFLLFYLGQ